MCFEVKKGSEPKVAQQDIYGYKTDGNFRLLRLFFKAAMYHYEYRIGKRQPPVALKVEEMVFSFGQPVNCQKIEAGYHLHKEAYAKRMRRMDERVAKFKIPKGATYYENDLQYVASEVIYLGSEKFEN